MKLKTFAIWEKEESLDKEGEDVAIEAGQAQKDEEDEKQAVATKEEEIAAEKLANSETQENNEVYQTIVGNNFNSDKESIMNILKENILENVYIRACVWTALAVAVVHVLEITEAHAVVQDLRAPMQALKTNIFTGWMWGVKVIAVAVGSIFAIMQQSITPFGIGAGIGAGIHFFDAYLGDGGAVLI
jgi:hypothetical protein